MSFFSVVKAAIKGAGVGSTVGSVVPGVGSLVGAVAGAAVGAVVELRDPHGQPAAEVRRTSGGLDAWTVGRAAAMVELRALGRNPDLRGLPAGLLSGAVPLRVPLVHTEGGREVASILSYCRGLSSSPPAVSVVSIVWAREAGLLAECPRRLPAQVGADALFPPGGSLARKALESL